MQSFFNATQSSEGVNLEGGVVPAPNIVGRLTLEKDCGPLHFGAFWVTIERFSSRKDGIYICSHLLCFYWKQIQWLRIYFPTQFFLWVAETSMTTRQQFHLFATLCCVKVNINISFNYSYCFVVIKCTYGIG